MVFKVCGMRNAENIRALWEVEPTHIGMIFHEKSPRNVLEELTGFPFHSELEDPINTGVFVNQSKEYIVKKVKAFKLRAVQLHGSESPELVEELKRENLQVIKVFSVDEGFDFKETEKYEKADFFLFDTKGKSEGGNGVAFDWNLLGNYSGEVPFILAGGIGPNSIEDLRLFLETESSKHCVGIDVNSGFEILPGLKDIEALKQFKTRLWN